MKFRELQNILKLSDRYIDLLPHILDYYPHGPLIEHVWLPHLMFFNIANYRSQSANTDERGFRHTYFNNSRICSFEDLHDRPVNIIVGGSTAFGVGATHDTQTIASQLSAHTHEVWLNFSCQTFTSTQELLLFLFHNHRFQTINNVVLFSGINNFFLYFLLSQYSQEHGSFYLWSQFDERMNNPYLSIRSRIVQFFFEPFFGNTIDYNKVNRYNFKGLFSRNGRKKLLRAYQSKEVFPSIKDHAEELENILPVIERDLYNWKSVQQARKFTLHYVLQPFLHWTDHQLAEEERLLMRELEIDTASRIEQVIQENKKHERHLWYREALLKICTRNDIPFYDSNELLSKQKHHTQWLFADKMHLTDLGNTVISDYIANEVLQ